ncbi:ABC transporter substrate-binding protein [Kurthia sibirica]|nr:ABC transporter substrate-binding protein [Kurthia sibirica]GEK34346.1 ABC transporter substrate-binding protein [Kurthia sibirica]
MKKFIVFCLLLCSAVALTACGDSVAKENKKGLKEVSVMLDWYPNAIHSFLYVAIDRGYFKEEGLDVTLQFPSNPTDPLTLTAAGQSTFGIYYQQDVIIAQANEGIPIKSIGPIVRSPLDQLMSLTETNIKRPRDLEGKKIGFNGTPLGEATIKNMVKTDGGDPSKIELIDVGFEIVSALITKQVDAITGGLINHELPVLEHKGYAISTINPSDYGVPKSYSMVFVAGDKIINKEPKTVQAFLRAANKGFDFAEKEPEQALGLLLKHQEKDNFPLTKSIEQQSLALLNKLMATDDAAFLSDEDVNWDEQSKWLKEQGIAEKIVPANELYSPFER